MEATNNLNTDKKGDLILANKYGDRVITKTIEPDNPKYPEALKTYLTDCHPIFVRGNLDILNKPAIAVVGSRDCTGYGIAVAKEIGKVAAEFGVTVISGLARGVDTAAHLGALEEGGKTVGVLANGLDLIYPKENRQIQESIQKNGLLISEYKDGTYPRPYNFPIRNRIIAALARFVVVVEAKERSGSLITAEICAEQGKEVFAIPGCITSKNSFGTNKLVRDGASIVVSIDEIFRANGFSKKNKIDESRKDLGLDELVVLKVIENSVEITCDEISEKTGFDISYINGIITVLEIKGLVSVEMGRVFIG